MPHDVINSVVGLIFLLYAAFRPQIFISMLSTDEMEYAFIHRTENDHPTYRCHQLKNCSHLFKIESLNILIWITCIDILMLGKCYQLNHLREHDEKKTNHSCVTLHGVR